jgi:hypothetical protein
LWASATKASIDHRLDVEPQRPEPLDRVDDEEDVPLTAEAANCPQVVAKAAGKLDETERDNPGPRVDPRENLRRLQPAIRAPELPASSTP